MDETRRAVYHEPIRKRWLSKSRLTYERWRDLRDCVGFKREVRGKFLVGDLKPEGAEEVLVHVNHLETEPRYHFYHKEGYGRRRRHYDPLKKRQDESSENWWQSRRKKGFVRFGNTSPPFSWPDTLGCLREIRLMAPNVLKTTSWQKNKLNTHWMDLSDVKEVAWFQVQTNVQRVTRRPPDDSSPIDRSLFISLECVGRAL